jgi:hypothetical protein
MWQHVLDLHGIDHDLVHGEWMDYLRAVECQFSRFGRADVRKQSSGGHLPRIRREDAVDFFPDLKLASSNANGDLYCYQSYDS